MTREDDAISRQAVLDTLDTSDRFMDEDRTVETYKALLKECYEVLPSVTPKQKMGRWIITYPHGIHNPIYECSCCHASNSSVFKSFCPHCGAKMEESE